MELSHFLLRVLFSSRGTLASRLLLKPVPAPWSPEFLECGMGRPSPSRQRLPTEMPPKGSGFPVKFTGSTFPLIVVRWKEEATEPDGGGGGCTLER